MALKLGIVSSESYFKQYCPFKLLQCILLLLCHTFFCSLAKFQSSFPTTLNQIASYKSKEQVAIKTRTNQSICLTLWPTDISIPSNTVAVVQETEKQKCYCIMWKCQTNVEFFICLTAPHCNHDAKLDHTSQPLENAISLSITPNPEECPQCAAALLLKEGAGLMGHSANGEEVEGVLEETNGDENRLDEKVDDDSEDLPKRKHTCFGKCKDVWGEIRVKLWGIVESKYFNRGIMIAILINTISMGIEHHNQVISPTVPSVHIMNPLWRSVQPHHVTYYCNSRLFLQCL